MNYGLLQPEEWSRIESVFIDNGSRLPCGGTISAAKNSRHEIVAFHCLQPVLHIEPIWVHDNYRGVVSFRKLLMPLKSNLPSGTEFYAFSPDERISRICAHLDLKQIPWTIWKGRS